MSTDLPDLERSIIKVLINQYESHHGHGAITVADIAHRVEANPTLVSFLVGEMVKRGDLNAEATGNNMGYVGLTDRAYQRYKALFPRP